MYRDLCIATCDLCLVTCDLCTVTCDLCFQAGGISWRLPVLQSRRSIGCLPPTRGVGPDCFSISCGQLQGSPVLSVRIKCLHIAHADVFIPQIKANFISSPLVSLPSRMCFRMRPSSISSQCSQRCLSRVNRRGKKREIDWVRLLTCLNTVNHLFSLLNP